MLIEYSGSMVEMDDDWSSSDFTNRTCLETPSNINVYCSCFSQDGLSQVFPSDMTGVTFYNCNLTNCIIPPGNTIIGGQS